MRKCMAIAAFCLICELSCIAQNNVNFNTQENLLHRSFLQLAQSNSSIEKETLCETISGILDSVLHNPESFDHPFDTLANLGKITSPDGKLRLYTWNLPYSDGSNRYYGFIQYKPERNTNPLVFRLVDKSDRIENPASAILDHKNWYGSLVYEIIGNSHNSTMHYVLLGYDPNSLFLSRKIIDILHFNDENEPVFGAPIFHYQGHIQTRVLFEYSARAQMTMHWVPDMNMIVFDHLSPQNPSYTGNYQFYGPDFSYDGYQFEDGIWKVIEDIDIRNYP